MLVIFTLQLHSNMCGTVSHDGMQLGTQVSFCRLLWKKDPWRKCTFHRRRREVLWDFEAARQIFLGMTQWCHAFLIRGGFFLYYFILFYYFNDGLQENVLFPGAELSEHFRIAVKQLLNCLVEANLKIERGSVGLINMPTEATFKKHLLC